MDDEDDIEIVETTSAHPTVPLMDEIPLATPPPAASVSQLMDEAMYRICSSVSRQVRKKRKNEVEFTENAVQQVAAYVGSMLKEKWIPVLEAVSKNSKRHMISEEDVKAIFAHNLGLITTIEAGKTIGLGKSKKLKKFNSENKIGTTNVVQKKKMFSSPITTLTQLFDEIEKQKEKEKEQENEKNDDENVGDVNSRIPEANEQQKNVDENYDSFDSDGGFTPVSTDKILVPETVVTPGSNKNIQKTQPRNTPLQVSNKTQTVGSNTGQRIQQKSSNIAKVSSKSTPIAKKFANMDLRQPMMDAGGDRLTLTVGKSTEKNISEDMPTVGEKRNVTFNEPLSSWDDSDWSDEPNEMLVPETVAVEKYLSKEMPVVGLSNRIVPETCQNQVDKGKANETQKRAPDYDSFDDMDDFDEPEVIVEKILVPETMAIPARIQQNNATLIVREKTNQNVNLSQETTIIPETIALSKNTRIQQNTPADKSKPSHGNSKSANLNRETTVVAETMVSPKNSRIQQNVPMIKSKPNQEVTKTNQNVNLVKETAIVEETMMSEISNAQEQVIRNQNSDEDDNFPLTQQVSAAKQAVQLFSNSNNGEESDDFSSWDSDFDDMVDDFDAVSNKAKETTNTKIVEKEKPKDYDSFDDDVFEDDVEEPPNKQKETTHPEMNRKRTLPPNVRQTTTSTSSNLGKSNQIAANRPNPVQKKPNLGNEKRNEPAPKKSKVNEEPPILSLPFISESQILKNGRRPPTPSYAKRPPPPVYLPDL